MKYYYDEIIKMQRIPDAFSRWFDYREELTSYVLEQAQKEHWHSFLYVGCGACNDLNLTRIVNVIPKVVLLDKEKPDIKMLEERYQLHGGALSYVQQDIAGLSPEFFYGFEELLMKEPTVERILEYLSCLEEEIKKLSQQSTKLQYDACCCIGIHSQCLAPFAVLVEIYSCAYSQKELDCIYKKLKEMNGIIAVQVNDFLLGAASRAMIGYEFGSLPMDIKKEIKDKLVQSYSHGKLQDLYNMGVQRVTGAFECEQDLKERYEMRKIALKNWIPCVWPFSSVKTYLMAIMCVQKKEE